MKLRIDLHVHSHYSHDSLIRPKELVRYATEKGLDGVAITDHDRLDSAQRIARETGFFIIPGMEISSKQGHIVALNVKEAIRPGLTIDETIDRIRDSGGISIACHPMTVFKGSVGKHTSSRFDAVEVINSSAVPFNYSVKYARKIAHSLGKPQVAGTDAHYGPQIGYAYTIVDAERDVDAVVRSIARGFAQPYGTAIPLTSRLKKELIILARRLFPSRKEL